MRTDLGVAVLAGLGGMAGWGFADFFAKKTIDALGDLVTLFWSQLIGVVPLVVVFAIQRNLPDLRWIDGLYLVLLGAASALSYLPLYSGFGKGQVSVLSPIFASYAVLVVLLSVIFFGETISGAVWLAIVVVVIGVLFISTDLGDIRRLIVSRDLASTAGVREVVAALVAYSVWLILFDRFLGHRDWVFFVLMIRSVSALTLLAYASIRRRSLDAKGTSFAPFLILIGLCDVGAYSAVAYGFSASPHTSIVAVLSSTFSLVTLVLASIFLRERLTRLQKVSASAILAGIVLVSVHL